VGGSPDASGGIELWEWPPGDGEAKAPVARRELHTDVIFRVAWSSDGRQLACASGDHAVSLIDASTLEVRRELTGHSAAVTSVVYLPGDRHLVTAGIDETLRVWDLATHAVIRSLNNHTAAVRDLAVQPHTNGTAPILASAGADRTVRLWQPLTGRLMRFARLPAEPLDVEWSADGTHVLVACRDGRLRVMDWETLVVQEQPGIEGWAYAVAATPDPQRVLLGGTAGKLLAIEWRPSSRK
jgi:WD40 repeat protein